jgi:hypothetical protein
MHVLSASSAATKVSNDALGLRLVREESQIDRSQELIGEICIAMPCRSATSARWPFSESYRPVAGAIDNSCSSVSVVRRIGLDFFGLFGMKCDRHLDDDSPGTAVRSRVPSSSKLGGRFAPTKGAFIGCLRPPAVRVRCRSPHRVWPRPDPHRDHLIRAITASAMRCKCPRRAVKFLVE